MAQKSVKRNSTVIDPNFFIPEGVDELSYSTGDVLDSEVEFVDDGSEFVEISDTDTDASLGYEGLDYADALDTPQILGIIPPQVIRMADSGAEVVDLIFEVDDVAGANDYEFRVTKI